MDFDPSVVAVGEAFIDSLEERIHELHGVPFKHPKNPFSLFSSSSTSFSVLAPVVSGENYRRLDSSRFYRDIREYEQWWNGNAKSLVDPKSFASRKKAFVEVLEGKNGGLGALRELIQEGDRLAAGLRESLGLYKIEVDKLVEGGIAYCKEGKNFLPISNVESVSQEFRAAGEEVLENYFSMRQYENTLLGGAIAVAHQAPRIGGFTIAVTGISAIALGVFAVDEVGNFLKGDFSPREIQNFVFSIALIPLSFGEVLAIETLKCLMT